MEVDRYETFRKFLLSKTVFDLTFVVSTYDLSFATNFAKKLHALIVGSPRKEGTRLKKIKREFERTIRAYDIPESVKEIIDRFVWRFFYYYEAEIGDFESEGSVRGKMDSLGLLPFPPIGPKDEEEEEKDETSKKRPRGWKIYEDEPGIKRVKVEGPETVDVEGSIESDHLETYDLELVRIVERIPYDVWGVIFEHLVRRSVNPYSDPKHVTTYNLEILKNMFIVSKTWAKVLPETIYRATPGFVYTNVNFGRSIDNMVEGGIKRLNLVDHLQTVLKGDWYDQTSVKKEGEKESHLSPYLDFFISTKGSFLHLTDLSFVYMSYGTRYHGIKLNTAVKSKWTFDLNFLMHLVKLQRLKIVDLTEPLRVGVTEKLTDLTSLTLKGWMVKMKENGSIIRLGNAPITRHQFETDEFTSTDEALWALPRLKELKISLFPGVTLPGLLKLTNLTKLHHEGEDNNNPLVKRVVPNHAYRLSHMTRLTVLKLKDSFIANMPGVSDVWTDTDPKKFDPSVYYDPMEDLGHMSRDFARLEISGPFSKIILDKLSDGLKTLVLDNATGDFRLTTVKPGGPEKPRMLTSLTVLSVEGIESEGFTFNDVASSSAIDSDDEDVTASMIALADKMFYDAKDVARHNATTLCEVAPNLEALYAWDEFDLTYLTPSVAKNLKVLSCSAMAERNYRIPVPPMQLTRFKSLNKLILHGYYFPSERCFANIASTLTELKVYNEYFLGSDEWEDPPKRFLDAMLNDVEGERRLRTLTRLESLKIYYVESLDPIDLFDLTNLTDLQLNERADVPYLSFKNSFRLNELVNLRSLTLSKEFVGKRDVVKLTNLTHLNVDYRRMSPDYEPADPIDLECVDFLPGLKTLTIDNSVVFSDLT